MKQICLNSVFFIFLFIWGGSLHAQENSGVVLSKSQLKLQKFENDVKRAEAKVNSIKAKLEVSDSLINIGKDMENEAISNIIILEKEGDDFTKLQNTEYKIINKQKKRASEDELEAISKEIKELDLKYKAQIKEIDKKLKVEYKKLQKGILNQEKGKEKQKQYQSSLEDYLDLLHDAEKKLEEFKIEIE